MAHINGGMLASKRNRSIHNVDNPIDADGFYRYMNGKKRRRALRRKEKQRRGKYHIGKSWKKH